MRLLTGRGLARAATLMGKGSVLGGRGLHDFQSQYNCGFGLNKGMSGYLFTSSQADADTLEREIPAWEAAWNETKAIIDWRRSTQDARGKLQHMYPSVSTG